MEDILERPYHHVDDAFRVGAEWQKQKDEKIYRDFFNERNEGDASFKDLLAFKEGVEIGREEQKQQMMMGAVTYTKGHRTAYVLGREQLNLHGWFEREREFIKLLGDAKEGDRILIIKSDASQRL